MEHDPFAAAGRHPASRVDGRAVAGESGLQDGRQSRRGARASAIAQADLKRLKILSEERKRIVAEHTALRAEILERHLAGADIERGRLTLCVTGHELRYFSHEQLVRLLGEEETEELKQLLIPKIQYTVRVTPTQ